MEVGSEQQLLAVIQKSQRYAYFIEEHLQHKIRRERRAWELILDYRGRYTAESLNLVFDTVDWDASHTRWFGQLLAQPNRNLILATPPERLNGWIEELLFAGHDARTALNICLTDLKIKGASKGLATVLLYLSDAETYNVWLDATQAGLEVLARMSNTRRQHWGEKYVRFNEAASTFRKKYRLPPQEVDWVLWFIGKHVTRTDQHLLVDQDALH